LDSLLRRLLPWRLSYLEAGVKLASRGGWTEFLVRPNLGFGPFFLKGQRGGALLDLN